MITIKPYHGWNKEAAQRMVNLAAHRSVGVGIPSDSKYPNGLSISDVAYRQEFGDGNVLPRPFVRNAMADKKTEWREEAKDALKSALDGNGGVETALEKVGERMKTDVVASLDALSDPPLKPATIAAKKKKGRQHPEKPLVDTGKMREAFKVEVTG